MLVVAVIFGVAIGGLGLWGVLAPSGMIGLTERFLKGHGLWIAVVVRLAIAIVLWLAAPTSGTPGVFRFLAALAFFAALILPFFGQARLDGLIGWWTAKPGWLVRMTCLAVVAFGAFLVASAGAGLRSGF